MNIDDVCAMLRVLSKSDYRGHLSVHLGGRNNGAVVHFEKASADQIMQAVPILADCLASARTSATDEGRP